MELMRAVGMAHLMSLRSRLDVVANNVANVNSTAFKGERARFRPVVFDMPSAGIAGLSQVQFIMPAGVFRDMSEGAVETTNNPLDLAIVGDGFFVAEDASGAQFYTRAGNFALNVNRELVTANGERVLDSAGAPIAFEEADRQITIDQDGRVFTERGEIAQLSIVRFADPQALTRVGNARFTTTQAPEPVDPGAVRIVQGALEKANVQPIYEMTRMIKILRSYQEMQQALERARETERHAIDRLPRVEV